MLFSFAPRAHKRLFSSFCFLYLRQTSGPLSLSRSASRAGQSGEKVRTVTKDKIRSFGRLVLAFFIIVGFHLARMERI